MKSSSVRIPVFLKYQATTIFYKRNRRGKAFHKRAAWTVRFWYYVSKHYFQLCIYRKIVINFKYVKCAERDSPAVGALRRAIAEVKQRWSVIRWMTKNILSRAPPCFEGTLSHWSRLHLQSLAPTNPYWARVVGYDPFSLCVIHKEGLWLSSGISRLMMMWDASSGIKRDRYH
jgi:hypothetical protein